LPHQVVFGISEANQDSTLKLLYGRAQRKLQLSWELIDSEEPKKPWQQTMLVQPGLEFTR